MKLTEITTKSGKKIEVYDDLFHPSTINEFYFDLRTMEFPLVPQNDTSVLDFQGVFGFGKNLDPSIMLGLVKRAKDAFPLHSFLRNTIVHRSWVNVFNGQHPTNRYHSDQDCIEVGDYVSMLYYANPKWDLEWDGGTVFRSDDYEEIEYMSDYKPGRIVLFESSIPHKIYQTSSLAHPYRFTVNTIFKNENLKRMR